MTPRGSIGREILPKQMVQAAAVARRSGLASVREAVLRDWMSLSTPRPLPEVDGQTSGGDVEPDCLLVIPQWDYLIIPHKHDDLLFPPIGSDRLMGPRNGRFQHRRVSF
jgi:hypothetical protein